MTQKIEETRKERTRRRHGLTVDGTKKIIVQKTKYDEPCYDASTLKAIADAFLKIFNTNEESSYYCDLDDDEVSRQEKEIAKIKNGLEKTLPDGLPESVYKVMEENKTYLKQLEREHANCKLQADLRKKALKGDADAAEELVMQRRDYEYEGFRVEKLR